jgi:hypothetical protein
MFVRSLAIFGAAAAFVAVNSADADAFFRNHRGGKIINCYKRVMTPAVYKTVMTQVMVRPASCSQYRTPPTYGTVAQEVMLQPSYQVAHTKPAVYGRVQVTRQVRPARTRWMRRGCRGGDYRCSVTTPARYRTRSKRVMMQPSQTWVETRPAVMGVEHRQVMLSAGTVKQTCQPAVYETVAERVLVSPGTEHWVLARHTEHVPRYHRAQYSAPEYSRPLQHPPMRQMPHGAPLK